MGSLQAFQPKAGITAVIYRSLIWCACPSWSSVQFSIRKPPQSIKNLGHWEKCAASVLHYAVLHKQPNNAAVFMHPESKPRTSKKQMWKQKETFSQATIVIPGKKLDETDTLHLEIIKPTNMPRWGREEKKKNRQKRQTELLLNWIPFPIFPLFSITLQPFLSSSKAGTKFLWTDLILVTQVFP